MSDRLVASSRCSSAPAADTTPAGEWPLDRFAQLVAEVAADPANAYNIEGYLWVLDGPPLRCCEHCGAWFDPWFDYDEGPARGLARRYCARRCAGRARYLRHRARVLAGRVLAAGVGEWGRAA